MSVLQRFFKDTIIYGLAIVLPRLINFLLVAIHTDVFSNEIYSDSTTFYIYAAFFNVLLAYGMETSFFRFFSKNKDSNKVFTTSLITITSSTLAVGLLVFSFNQELANFMQLPIRSFNLLVSITLIEALIIIPFAYLRVTGRPIRFAVIKLINVFIIVAFNILFLHKNYGSESVQNLFNVVEIVEYQFIANLLASICVLLLVSPYFFKSKLSFDKAIFKQLLTYGWPIMIAGIAFVINENLDKFLIPKLIGKDTNGAYSACYKLAVFMTLFIQAFRMGAEPFFFNHADKDNAKQTYATILKYFTIVGSIGLLGITVYLDVIKNLLIKNESFLFAMDIVPIVLLANLCLGIYHNLSIWYKLTDKTKYGMYISIFGAILTIGFNWFLIPILGYMACAYATLVAYGSMMLVSYYLGRKHYFVPYQINRIVTYLIISSTLAFLAFYQFDRNIYIGTLFLVVFLGLIFYLEKKEFKQLLKQN
ncbi:MAG: polysaccharide biosynthesis protein [Flavobacteriaceae bacterium]|nr:polysaccharide biosynthesis protein [Flavobacteriaceae bacterium]